MSTPTTPESTAEDQPWKISASFGVRADKLNPAELTERLGMQPSRAFARGDAYRTHISRTETGVRTRPFGVWAVSSEGVVESADVQDHVDYLVGLLRPKQVEINALLADPDFYLQIRLWLKSHDAVNAFGLEPESLALLASLCREFVVVVSGPEGQREEE